MPGGGGDCRRQADFGQGPRRVLRKHWAFRGQKARPSGVLKMFQQVLRCSQFPAGREINGLGRSKGGDSMAPKYQMVADSLRSSILEGAYEKRRLLPTEHALCQQFQVSRQTVRQALSLLASEGLIDRRQGSGSHVLERMPAAEPRRSIAVVTTYISDYIFPSILRQVETVLSQNNCSTLLFATQNQVSEERRVLKTLLDLSPLDGILVEGTKTGLPNPNLDLYERLIQRKIPLVFMNGYYPQLKDPLSVLDDNYAGGRMLVEYLHGKGHREIGGIFKNDDIQGPQRYAGYIDALRDLSLPMNDQRIFWYNTELKERFLSERSIEIITRALEGCTAVVCYNDEIASRLVTHLTKQGVSIPEELAVVSFDNSQYSELSSPRVTSLSHGRHNVGRMAAELLIQLLQGERCHSLLAPWELVEKESG